MRESQQDGRYRGGEADAFFERNFAKKAADPNVLRPYKEPILRTLEEVGAKPKHVLEYGCGYGDLLHHFATKGGAQDCRGVEPSDRSVAFGTEAYAKTSNLSLHTGTIASNAVNDDAASTAYFDLIIIDDVFCWVSRETLFQSVANIDDVLADGGLLFIREFFPLANTRNRNHHVDDAEVYCYKPYPGHTQMFTSSGVYEPIYQRVWMDHEDGWVKGGGRDAFQSRWRDSVLRKSLSGYFD